MNERTPSLTAALADRYAIESKLGEGGMASVYLARDLKHDRRVAVKVLRPELAAVLGAERFLNEIKVTANLQHAHILALFDSGQADGFLYYVMPYVEGESLGDRLDREKQLPVEEAIRIATEVASALDYAHRHDVIHRDIKPQNILLHDGQALVADFGIALAVSVAGGGRLTETGLSLGTPHYMSPEQAMGDREVDTRSDIYSLGATVYEMLVGEPPFTGPTAQSVVTKVLIEEPQPITEQRRTVPPHMDATVRKALQKLPADRFSTAGQFAEALARPSADILASQVGRVTAGLAKPGFRSQPVVAWALTAVAVAVAAFAWLRAQSAPEDPTRRWSINLPESAPVALSPWNPLGVPRRALAVSPTGELIVYVGVTVGRTQLYLRRLDEFEATPVPGTEAAADPFFSPDGEWIGFFAGTELKKVAVRGGNPIVVTNATNAWGGGWTEDGEILFTPGEGSQLVAVPASGGTPRILSDTASTGFYSRPHPLPGADVILVNGLSPRTVVAVSLATGEHKALVSGSSPRYLPTGHLVFARGSTLFAVLFDVDALELRGDPVPILSGVRVARDVAQFDVSRSGTIFFVPGRSADEGPLVWAGRDGSVDTLLFDAPLPYGIARVAPDGRRLVVEILGSTQDIWLYDLERVSRSRLATTPVNRRPIWAPDGSAIVYSSTTEDGGNRTDIMRRPVGGSVSESLASWDYSTNPSSWSRDGEWIAFHDWGVPGTGGDIWILRADGSAEPESFLRTPHNEWGAEFSPDGRWIAYTSDESGEYQVYVEPFPRTDDRWQVSTEDNSEEPAWSPDGRELYYRTGSRWMVVPVTLEPTFSAGRPTVLFEGPYLNVLGRSYDVHPDGNRFLVIHGPEETTADRINVITNWLAEVERLAPDRNR